MTKKNTDESIVVVKLSGGLGNQMFQYAFGLAYCRRHNMKLKFYAGDLIEKNEHNGLELDKVFNIHLELATKQEILNLDVIREPHIHYSQEIANTRQSGYYCGWWNSIKYFKDYENEVKNIFNWNVPYSVETITDVLQETRSVAIHFRRGDYVVGKNQLQVFHNLGERYYIPAIVKAAELCNTKAFRVFSDDCETAIEFFTKVKRRLDPTINIQFLINPEKERAYLDMYAMSKCVGLVGANSSFSWWAAMLNSNPDKKIIMPKSWYMNGYIQTKDLYPENCIVI